MKISKHMTESLKYKLLIFFSLVGVCISAYLAYIYIFSLPLPCGSTGCDTVRSSKYAKILSVPVPVYGIAFYLSITLVSIGGLINIQKAKKVILLLSSIGFLMSVYFTFLEIFVIKAICNWCVVSAIVATIIFVLSLLARKK